jgi:hypothetical protein
MSITKSKNISFSPNFSISHFRSIPSQRCWPPFCLAMTFPF